MRSFEFALVRDGDATMPGSHREVIGLSYQRKGCLLEADRTVDGETEHIRFSPNIFGGKLLQSSESWWVGTCKGKHLPNVVGKGCFDDCGVSFAARNDFCSDALHGSFIIPIACRSSRNRAVPKILLEEHTVPAHISARELKNRVGASRRERLGADTNPR